MGSRSSHVVHSPVANDFHGSSGTVQSSGSWAPAGATGGHVMGTGTQGIEGTEATWGAVQRTPPHPKRHPKVRFRFFCDMDGRNCELSDKWGGPSRQRMEGNTRPVLQGMLQPEFYRLAMQVLDRDFETLPFKKGPSKTQMLNGFI